MEACVICRHTSFAFNMLTLHIWYRALKQLCVLYQAQSFPKEQLKTAAHEAATTNGLNIWLATQSKIFMLIYPSTQNPSCYIFYSICFIVLVFIAHYMWVQTRCVFSFWIIWRLCITSFQLDFSLTQRILLIIITLQYLCLSFLLLLSIPLYHILLLPSLCPNKPL